MRRAALPWTRRSWRLACQAPPRHPPLPHLWPPRPVSPQPQPPPHLLQQLLSAAPPPPTRGALPAPLACPAGSQRAPAPLVPPPPPRSSGQLCGLRQLQAGQRRRPGAPRRLRAPLPLLRRTRRPRGCWLWVQARGRQQLPCPCPFPPPLPQLLPLVQPAQQQQQPSWQPLPRSSRAGPVINLVRLWTFFSNQEPKTKSRYC